MASVRSVTLGLVQMSCDEDLTKNLDKAVSRITAAAEKGAEIVCLQELFRSRYFCQANDKKFFDLAEPVPGPATELLGKVAKEKKVVIVASLYEKGGPNLFNTACAIDADGRFLGKYRKVHIPDDPANHYSESFYFKPGNLGFPVFQTRYAKIGLQVCWDQWFPEGARALALQGAEIIFYPTAIGWPARANGGRSPSEVSDETSSLTDGGCGVEGGISPRLQIEEIGQAEFNAWVTVQRGHAISNTVFVAAANRTGLEDHLQFWGGSFVADPLGRILKQASHDKEENLIVRCEMGRIGEVRKDWPFLRCRRPDAY